MDYVGRGDDMGQGSDAGRSEERTFTDEEIDRLLRIGDRDQIEAFAKWFLDNHAGTICGVLLRRGGDWHDAIDAILHLLGRLCTRDIPFKSLYSHDHWSSARFTTWFTAGAIRMHQRLLSQKARELTSYDFNQIAADDERDDDGDGGRKKRMAALVEGFLEGLELKDRTIVSYYFKNMNNPGWAQELESLLRGTSQQMTVNNIRVRFHRLRSKYEDAYEHLSR